MFNKDTVLVHPSCLTKLENDLPSFREDHCFYTSQRNKQSPLYFKTSRSSDPHIATIKNFLPFFLKILIYHQPCLTLTSTAELSCKVFLLRSFFLVQSWLQIFMHNKFMYPVCTSHKDRIS